MQRVNLIARWLDVLRIGVVAGLDFPSAITLAGDTISVPALRRDGAEMILALAAGMPLSTAQGQLLPANVPMAIECTPNREDLPATLQVLCDLYERQAELRLERLQSVMTPMLVMLIATLVGAVTCGLLYPLIVFIREITNVGKL